MERKQIRLDEQADHDAELIQRRYSLNSRSAAIRFALRELARQIEQKPEPKKQDDQVVG